jgi:hypothetical protein
MNAVFSKGNIISFVSTLGCMWIAVALLCFALRLAGRHVNPLLPHWPVVVLTALGTSLWEIYSPLIESPGASLSAQIKRIDSAKSFGLVAAHNLVGMAIMVPMALILGRN